MVVLILLEQALKRWQIGVVIFAWTSSLKSSNGCCYFCLNELSKLAMIVVISWLADKICTHVSNNTECRCGKKWGGSWRPSWDDHRWGCFFVTPNFFLLGIFCRIHIQLFLLFFFCYRKSASVIVPWTWQFFCSFPLLAGINCNGFFFPVGKYKCSQADERVAVCPICTPWSWLWNATRRYPTIIKWAWLEQQRWCVHCLWPNGTWRLVLLCIKLPFILNGPGLK